MNNKNKKLNLWTFKISLKEKIFTKKFTLNGKFIKISIVSQPTKLLTLKNSNFGITININKK